MDKLCFVSFTAFENSFLQKRSPFFINSYTYAPYVANALFPEARIPEISTTGTELSKARGLRRLNFTFADASVPFNFFFFFWLVDQERVLRVADFRRDYAY